MNLNKWARESWREFPALQQPAYVDSGSLAGVRAKLEKLPPLVLPAEIDRLKGLTAAASAGKSFILQGGDCAERFEDCEADLIANKIKIMLQMSLILTFGARKPVIRLGRIAGQYSKPRSQPTEKTPFGELSSYKGDAVNSHVQTAEGRSPDPERLVSAYFHSSATLNYIRGLLESGFADLHNPYSWNLHSIEESDAWPRYSRIVNGIVDAVSFMESFGGLNPDIVARAEFYTSHEGLVLEYEEAMTRFDAGSGRWYNAGAHMLWIGERTRQIDGAHAEYFRGIANPIGIKAGPDADPHELEELIGRLNPSNEDGRITLITRMGDNLVAERLPGILKHLSKSNLRITYSCDPMHGNIYSTDECIKTRDFNRIMSELSSSFRIHSETGLRLAGVHFELTGDDVTECVGGSSGISHSDLATNYQSFCDPRLNCSQSLEMALLIAELLSADNGCLRG